MRNLIILLAALLAAEPVQAQCTKDTDCKGDRICERSVCVSPPNPAQSSPTAPGLSGTSGDETKPLRFEEYSVGRHTGTWKPPSGLRRVGPNEWRDENGKLVDAPRVNFAAKYMILLHSCGTGCRHYTLTDLSTGRRLDTLDAFAAVEPAPTTREGYTYITDLVGRPDSNLLVAQYQVSAPAGIECRERAFVFEADKLRPVSNTRRGCTKY